MKNRTKRFFIAVAFICALPAFSGMDGKLRTSTGSLSLGGRAAFPIEWNPSLGPTVQADLNPEFGVFLFDGFQLILQAKLRTLAYGDLAFGTPDQYWNWGLGAGIEYLFDLDWLVLPFVGFSFDFQIAGITPYTAKISLSVPMGVYLPVNENVAVVFGAVTQVSLVGQPNVFKKLRFEPGYLGIKAFF